MEQWKSKLEELKNGIERPTFDILWCDKQLFPDWFPWLRPDFKDEHKARCDYCKKSFCLSINPWVAIANHSKGKKHKSRVQSKKLSGNSSTEPVSDPDPKPEPEPTPDPEPSFTDKEVTASDYLSTSSTSTEIFSNIRATILLPENSFPVDNETGSGPESVFVPDGMAESVNKILMDPKETVVEEDEFVTPNLDETIFATEDDVAFNPEGVTESEEDENRLGLKRRLESLHEEVEAKKIK